MANRKTIPSQWRRRKASFATPNMPNRNTTRPIWGNGTVKTAKSLAGTTEKVGTLFGYNIQQAEGAIHQADKAHQASHQRQSDRRKNEFVGANWAMVAQIVVPLQNETPKQRTIHITT